MSDAPMCDGTGTITYNTTPRLPHDHPDADYAEVDCDGCPACIPELRGAGSPQEEAADRIRELQAEIQRLREAQWSAFVAGFSASGEGWNGEWPFSDHNKDPAADPDLREKFDVWVDALTDPKEDP